MKQGLVLAFKPEQFSGGAPHVSEKWFYRFNRYSSLIGISKQDKCLLMPLLFNGTAELWFNSLTFEFQTRWDKLENAFRKRFIDDCHHRQERILDLLHFKQGKQTFEQYFEFMIGEMTSLGFRDDIQLAFIVSNLEPRLKSLILQHQPYNSTAELYQKGLVLENSLNFLDHSTATYYQENKNQETDHASACDNSHLQRFDSYNSVSEFVETINSSISCDNSDNADNCPRIATEKSTTSKHVRYSVKDTSKCEIEVKPYLCVNRCVKSTVTQHKTSSILCCVKKTKTRIPQQESQNLQSNCEHGGNVALHYFIMLLVVALAFCCFNTNYFVKTNVVTEAIFFSVTIYALRHELLVCSIRKLVLHKLIDQKAVENDPDPPHQSILTELIAMVPRIIC